MRRAFVADACPQGVEVNAEDELAQEEYVSALPFLPPLNEKTLNTYYAVYGLFFAGVIAFGGIAAPILEVKLGLGGEYLPALRVPRCLQVMLGMHAL